MAWLSVQHRVAQPHCRFRTSRIAATQRAKMKNTTLAPRYPLPRKRSLCANPLSAYNTAGCITISHAFCGCGKGSVSLVGNSYSYLEKWSHSSTEHNSYSGPGVCQEDVITERGRAPSPANPPVPERHHRALRLGMMLTLRRL